MFLRWLFTDDVSIEPIKASDDWMINECVAMVELKWVEETEVLKEDMP
jgi:hypothetical protein